jgi:hypothetical protein
MPGTSGKYWTLKKYNSIEIDFVISKQLKSTYILALRKTRTIGQIDCLFAESTDFPICARTRCFNFRVMWCYYFY